MTSAVETWTAGDCGCCLVCGSGVGPLLTFLALLIGSGYGFDDFAGCDASFLLLFLALCGGGRRPVIVFAMQCEFCSEAQVLPSSLSIKQDGNFVIQCEFCHTEQVLRWAEMELPCTVSFAKQ